MSSSKRFFLMIALTLLWSPSFIFIKLAVEELPPFTIVAARVTLGALGFVGVLLFLGRSLPTNRSFWIHSVMMALFSSVLPFCLFCYAEESIESALAAILNGTSPMFTAILAQMFVVSDRMNAKKAIGIGLGIIGLLFLFAPNILQGMSGTSMGMLAATAASFCYAMSHVYAKTFLTGQKPFIFPAAQLLTSAAILIPVALWYDQPWNLAIPSGYAIGGILGMSISLLLPSGWYASRIFISG
jgi:drug/metabolite transporter (DMT)-like permease